MDSENIPDDDPNAQLPENGELDGAIDGLRDVLQQDAEGLDLPIDDAEPGGLPDIGSDFGGDIGSDFGGDIGGDFSAGGDLGGDIGGDFGVDSGAGGLGGGQGDGLGGDFAMPSGPSADINLNNLGGADGANFTGATGTTTRADLILNIPVDVQVVLGTSRMQVSELMDLSEGATIGLDRKIGEAVEIVVNGKLIGRGEITVLENDGTRFGVKMIEIVGAKAEGK